MTILPTKSLHAADLRYKERKGEWMNRNTKGRMIRARELEKGMERIERLHTEGSNCFYLYVELWQTTIKISKMKTEIWTS